jgi:hypothetical protein
LQAEKEGNSAAVALGRFGRVPAADAATDALSAAMAMQRLRFDPGAVLPHRPSTDAPTTSRVMARDGAAGAEHDGATSELQLQRPKFPWSIAGAFSSYMSLNHLLPDILSNTFC